jgi:hypothetical protein
MCPAARRILEQGDWAEGGRVLTLQQGSGFGEGPSGALRHSG